MPERSALLKKLFEIGNLQELQDKVSFATDISMITVDFTGNPISTHSGCSEFCNRIRRDPILCELCKKCDSRGGLEAARLSKPYIYICHMGLVDFATPIFLQDTYVGSVMAGQIKLTTPSNKLERVTSIQNEDKLEGAVSSLYKTLPSMSLERINAWSHMIFYLYNYVIKEASQKMDPFFINPKLALPEKDKDSILSPAIKYINKSFTKSIKLNTLASLCDISSSYFSKMFKKIMNVNLTTYVNSLRIEKATFLLKKTNKPIVDIAYEVGFVDCGYFIKIFKKFKNQTPNSYRKQANRLA